MNNLINLVDGKKTYIGAGIIFVAGGLKALGKIDDNTFQIIVAFGTSVTVVGIRSAIKKLA